MTAGSETAQKEMPLGRTSLAELAPLFLRLGSTAFGGPAAHIAMMRDEVVRRRKWLTDEYFLDLLGATNLIPGPNSTEMAIHIRWNRRRWSGLVVAGVTFILPAMLITGLSGGRTFGSGSCPKRRGCSGESSPLTEAVGIAKVARWTLRFSPWPLD
jgi:chromate transporter